MAGGLEPALDIGVAVDTGVGVDELAVADPNCTALPLDAPGAETTLAGPLSSPPERDASANSPLAKIVISKAVPTPTLIITAQTAGPSLTDEARASILWRCVVICCYYT